MFHAAQLHISDGTVEFRSCALRDATGSTGPRRGAVDDGAKVVARRQQAKRAGRLVTKTRGAKAIGHRRRRMLEEERALRGKDKVAHDGARLCFVAPIMASELLLQPVR
jgi:hypothetical protein